MSDSLHPALLFLVNTLFDLYLFVMAIRLVLAYIGSNYYDPLTQFTVRLTDCIVKPVRRVLPNVRGIEISTLVLIFAIEIIKFTLISLLSFGIPAILGLVILAFGDVLQLMIQIFFYAILLQALLSWIQPMSPMNRILYQFTSPIMRPLHRIIPPVGGFDITPIPALIGLQFLTILLVNPIMATGFGAIR